MEYTPATEFCNEEQIKNLWTLLHGVKTLELKTEFNMGSYSCSPTIYNPYPREVTDECGTICCLAGHGPLVGVKALVSETSWARYIERVFTESISVEAFLFSSAWVSCQPSKEEALFRLKLFLTKGLPEDFRGGYDILTYKNFSENCEKGLHTLGETV